MMAAGKESSLPTPRAPARTGGLYLSLPHGIRVLDATGHDGRRGAGHGRERLAAVMAHAEPGAATPAERAALRQRLAALMPPLLDEIAFTVSGAQAMGRAIGMARDFHKGRGQPRRQRIIVCARPTAEPSPFDPEDVFVGRDLRAIASQLVVLGPDKVAAIVIEPLGLADGLTPPGAADVRDLRTLCDRSGVLLISDETAAGLGRVGTMTAAQRLGLIPDIAVMGEVLTNDAAPLGLVVARSEMADLAVDSEPAPSAAAIAAALETLAIYEDEELMRRSAELEPYWQQSVNSLATAPAIAEIRTLGLAAALVLTPRPGEAGARGQLLFKRSMDYGVLTRVQDDTLLLTPSLIVTKDQIDEIVEKLSAALRKIT
jgi:beta-alanine--pyruvate transaminase